MRPEVDPASGEGFLTGDAVNVAARLQSAAPPMAVAVGEATHAATENVFAFDACHPIAVKGKREPLCAWIATAPLARTGAELRSFSSEFVGREEELAELQALLDETAAAGRLCCALLVGEPGIGKSRLLAEFARRLDDHPGLVTWRQGRCLPFGSGVTFWALSEIVRAETGVLESDGVARAEARLEAVLPEGPDRDRLRARLRPLLGLEAQEATREENFAAWRQFLEGLAASDPTVLVVEDLHWADEAMLAFMDYLAGSEAPAPLLVVASARPEVLEIAGPGASFVETAAHLPLGPLSGEETAELARARLGAKSLPTDLQALILERSGGNPLFAEELVRLLQDRGLLEERSGKVALRPGAEVPLPDSIGALIAARLDLLSAERKALLADASVVGRTFWAGALAAVGEAEPAQVYEGLMELVAKELVRPERSSTMEGESEFLFVHALVCDVAYSQLTRADRAAKHARLAKWLEERTAGRTEDLAEVLAFHYGTALEMAIAAGLFDLEDELAEPTERYLSLAGGRAAPLDAAAAAAHFARAERVADEAARPKRRFLLSRRTRRTLKRRAPLLVAAAAVIVVALVAALAVLEFRPADDAPTGLAQLTTQQIAGRYGDGIVDISARVRVADKQHRIVWKTVHQSGVVASEDGFIYTSDARLARRPLSSPRPSLSGCTATAATARCPASGSRRSDPLPDTDQGRPQPGGPPPRAARRLRIRAQGDRVICLSRYPESGILLTSPGSVASTRGGTTSSHERRGYGIMGENRVCYMVTGSPTKSPRGGALVDVAGRLIGIMGPWYRTPRIPPPRPDPHGPRRRNGRESLPRDIDNAQNNLQRDLPVTLGIDHIAYLTPEVTRTKLVRSFGLGGQGDPHRGHHARQPRRRGWASRRSPAPEGQRQLGAARRLVVRHRRRHHAGARRDTDAHAKTLMSSCGARLRGGGLRARAQIQDRAARRVTEGQHSQRWLLRHYWRPVTLKVTLGPATPVTWIW